MVQTQFAAHITAIIQQDETVVGLAVAGSWLTNDLDQFSDLDLILVTAEKVGDHKEKMLAYAERFGTLLSAFTGEHVGETRLLICLYDNPLLHVDIKFLTLEECSDRIENPVILFDRDGRLQTVIDQSNPEFPFPGYQWIEDRFWVWVHYVLTKIGRGEYFEAINMLGQIRMMVHGPLLHIKNRNLPRNVRKIEMEIPGHQAAQLQATLADYSRRSLIQALNNMVLLYRELREDLFGEDIIRRNEAERSVMNYYEAVAS
jgi:predicted nucleotidyltransferase